MPRQFTVWTMLAVLASWACVPSVVRGDDESRGRKLAVVVGNNEYRPNQGLNNLHQAVNDARRLSEALRKAEFTVIEMTHEFASRPGKVVLAPNADYIRDQLDGVIESPNLGENDTVLVSLHGHGVKFDFEETVIRNGQAQKQVTPKFYFCPADAAPAGVKIANDLTERNHLIPLDELYSKLEGCKAATKLLIVDACRNDPTRGEFRSQLESATRPKLPPPPGGIAAFFSCKENQRAVEDPDLKQGVFTHFLIQGLEGRADQPLEGKPADGVITLSELTSYVANNTHAYVLDKYNGTRQSPDIKGEFDTNTPLVRVLIPLAELTKNIHVQARAYLSVDQLPAGGTCQIIVLLEVDEGFSINTNPPIPQFMPTTKVAIKSTAGAQLVDMKYPKGTTFRYSGDDTEYLVYQGTVAMHGTIKVPDKAAGQTDTLEVTISYQVNTAISSFPTKIITLTGKVPVANVGEVVKPINMKLFAPKLP